MQIKTPRLTKPKVHSYKSVASWMTTIYTVTMKTCRLYREFKIRRVYHRQKGLKQVAEQALPSLKTIRLMPC